MNEERVIIESLAMDLKRVAIGLQRGSTKMADRFKAEALQRENELERVTNDGYILRIITGSRESLESNSEQTSDDALMYSTLFQNYAQKRY